PSSSARIRTFASQDTLRTRIPSIRAPLCTELWACSEHTTRSRPVAWRAATSAAIVPVDAESSMWPCQPEGRPRSCAVQSRTTPTSSAEAGQLRHIDEIDHLLCRSWKCYFHNRGDLRRHVA